MIDPLGIGYLSSYLKKVGHVVDIVQTKEEDIKSKIIGYLPEILAYSVTTGKHKLYKELDNQIKLWYDAKSVFGGPHVTFFPQYITGEDIGIRGEGFDAFPELVSCIEKGKDFGGLQNIVYQGKVNSLRPIKDKFGLLFPDRELMYKYPKNRNNPIKNIMCSFECPMSCTYCYNPKYKELYGITRSEIRKVNSVIEEVRQLEKYPLDLIFFQDDVFPIDNQKWIDEFVMNYRMRTNKKPFHIQIRIEMLTEDIVKKLKDAGLHGVTFAIESGNEGIRRTILNRKMTEETIIKGAELLNKHGIKIRTENIIGIPQETLKDMENTIKLNAKCKPDIAWASVYQPYPGTSLGDQCIEKGLFDGNLDNISETFFDTYRLKSNNTKQIERFQKLFSLMVLFSKYLWCFEPFLYLPLDKVYSLIYKKCKTYLYKKRLYAT